MNNTLKIKNTALDRRFKLSDEDVNLIKSLKEDGFTNKELATLFNVNTRTIYSRLLDESKYNKQKDYIREQKAIWYNNKSEDERTEMNKRWKDSYESYIKELIQTKINYSSR